MVNHMRLFGPRYRFKLIALLCLWCSSDPGLAAASHYQAHYKVSARGLPLGKAQHDLSVDAEGHYRYHFRTESTLPFVEYKSRESSAGYITNNQVIPQQYHFQRKKYGKQEQVAVNFDWENAVAHLIASESRDIVLQVGMQDKLSYHLALKFAILNQKLPQAFQFIDKKGIKHYPFSYLGDETLNTILGSVDTVKIQRQQEASNRATTLWLAPKLDYVLIKVVEHKDGKLLSKAELSALRYKKSFFDQSHPFPAK